MMHFYEAVRMDILVKHRGTKWRERMQRIKGKNDQ